MTMMNNHQLYHHQRLNFPHEIKNRFNLTQKQLRFVSSVFKHCRVLVLCLEHVLATRRVLVHHVESRQVLLISQKCRRPVRLPTPTRSPLPPAPQPLCLWVSTKKLLDDAHRQLVFSRFQHFPNKFYISLLLNKEKKRVFFFF